MNEHQKSKVTSPEKNDAAPSTCCLLSVAAAQRATVLADAGPVYENFLCRLPIFFLTRVPAELNSDRRMKAEVQGRQAIVRGSDGFIVEPLEFPLVFFRTLRPESL